MIKGLIRFVLGLALGAVLGYVFQPTISEKVEGTKVENAIETVSEVSNVALQNKLASTKAE